ncbi:MerR family transcriptional regulator [Deinococcus hohokamensis]|uniref:MerR family transcriptional regulator n=1 Tax=Deinococcus hohokamensis TaxID=309883 RepID=A0ABV9IBQ4_9DEIO
MTDTQHWTVGEVAELTRVSIRTLHHYDAVGLLVPSARSEANYRLYTAADLARLWRILTFRELGFPLSEIARLERSPEEGVGALRLQAALLREQLARSQRRLDTVTSLLEAAESGKGDPMNSEQMKTMFDGFDPAQYEAEARERWGETEAYRQSAERTRRYGPAEWAQLKTEGEALTARYLALMDAGVAPGRPEAQAVAAEHRAYFSRWFYNASADMMRGLAQMWVQDERFTRNIDKARPGLAAYQSAVVDAWADSQVSQAE